jgi:hypothetical protein
MGAYQFELIKCFVITCQIEPIILETAQHSIRVNSIKSLPAKCIHYASETCSGYSGTPFPMNLSAMKPCAGI